MRHMVAVSSAVVFWAAFGITFAVTEQTKLCFKGTEAEPTGNITLSCPEGQVIIIYEALFGRNKWGACVIASDDCVEKTRIFHECENINNCPRSFKTYLTTCGGYATVMFISYNCVQVSYVPPTTIIKTTTSSTKSTTKNVKNSAVPKLQKTAQPSEVVSKDESDKLTEIGLIAGCVVAAVVTVIALVIAIIMVVRRLMYSEEDEDEATDSSESKRYTRCICIDCSPCFKTNQHANQHRLDTAEKIPASSTAPKEVKKETSVQTGTTSKEKKLNSEAGDKNELGLYPVLEVGYENINLSSHAPPTIDTTTNRQRDAWDKNKLDSNGNSRIHSSNAVEGVYCNVPTNGRSQGQTPRTNKNVYNPLTAMSVPKYDAVSIPNTARGTNC